MLAGSILTAQGGGSILQPPVAIEAPPDPNAAANLRHRILNGLLPRQEELCSDTDHKLVAYCAGLGAGKTYCLCAWATILAIDNPGQVGALFEPTGPLVRDVLQRSLEEYWDSIGMAYDYRASPLPEYQLHHGAGPSTRILCRSMENWRRIVGANWAFIGSDEIDTSRTEDSRQAMRKFLGRIRDANAPRRQIGLFSTPEGFGLLYQMFVEDGQKVDRKLYRGRTADNPYLPPDYLETLLQEYPANLVQAYTEGLFVNMASSSVYPDFDRALNYSHLEEVPADRTLYLGVDFNVDRSWIVVLVQVGPDLHVIREHVARDVPQIIDCIREHYQPWIDAGRLIVCPDASGRGRSATDAGISAMGMLRAAGFRTKVKASNPFIKDRVLSVNCQILNGNNERRLRVHPSCSGVTRGLEQQSYNLATQQPEKGNGGPQDLSGQCDALGYAVWQVAGIKPFRTGSTRMQVWS